MTRSLLVCFQYFSFNPIKLDVIPLRTLAMSSISGLHSNYLEYLIVGDTVSDFGLPWDLLAEIDFLV